MSRLAEIGAAAVSALFVYGLVVLIVIFMLTVSGDELRVERITLELFTGVLLIVASILLCRRGLRMASLCLGQGMGSMIATMLIFATPGDLVSAVGLDAVLSYAGNFLLGCVSGAVGAAIGKGFTITAKLED